MATMDTGIRSSANPDRSALAKQGLIGGMVAGIVFAMFEMIMAAVLNGASAFFMPLRLIGAIVLGQEALMPGYSLVGAAITGAIVHMILATMFGLVLAVLLSALPATARSAAMTIAIASVYGFVLWVVNFYVIAPIGGWDWFPRTNETVQFFAHTFFFGSVLGAWLSRVSHEPRGTRS